MDQPDVGAFDLFVANRVGREPMSPYGDPFCEFVDSNPAVPLAEFVENELTVSAGEKSKRFRLVHHSRGTLPGGKRRGMPWEAVTNRVHTIVATFDRSE